MFFINRLLSFDGLENAYLNKDFRHKDNDKNVVSKDIYVLTGFYLFSQ